MQAEWDINSFPNGNDDGNDVQDRNTAEDKNLQDVPGTLIDSSLKHPRISVGSKDPMPVGKSDDMRHILQKDSKKHDGTEGEEFFVRRPLLTLTLEDRNVNGSDRRKDGPQSHPPIDAARNEDRPASILESLLSARRNGEEEYISEELKDLVQVIIDRL